MSVQQLIRHYGLEPHPEGGWYREVHRSGKSVRRADGVVRSALTAILFLLPHGEISRWHRVAAADETWHHAGGDPLELLTLPPQGGPLRRQRLAAMSLASGLEPGGVDAASDGLDGAGDLASPLAVVPAGWWQAARSLGAWSLVSCCVGPGFDFDDFQLLRDLPQPQHPSGVLADYL